MVGLLWLAHDQACEADLAAELDRLLAAGDLPDPEALQTSFAAAPDAGRPDIPVHMPAAGSYDDLISGQEAAA